MFNFCTSPRVYFMAYNMMIENQRIFDRALFLAQQCCHLAACRPLPPLKNCMAFSISAIISPEVITITVYRFFIFMIQALICFVCID